MAATGTPTTNLGLRCPLGTDPASVDDINYNSGVIDEKMGAVGNTSVQAQLDALNSKIANPKNVAYTSVTGTSQAQFETALTTALNGMGTGEARVCPAYANYSQSLTNGGQGVAFLVKQQSTVWWCFLVYAGGVRAGYYTSNAWTWI